jgi:hypothetical protein
MFIPLRDIPSILGDAPIRSTFSRTCTTTEIYHPLALSSVHPFPIPIPFLPYFQSISSLFPIHPFPISMIFLPYFHDIPSLFPIHFFPIIDSSFPYFHSILSLSPAHTLPILGA